MSTGYLGANGACFATAQAAADNYYSSQSPMLSYAGSSNVFYLGNYFWNGSNWAYGSYRCTQTGIQPGCTYGSFAVGYQPASCDLQTSTDTFVDGMALGWGIVAAMAAAWGITFLRKALY